MKCPVCDSAVQRDHSFCENCGHELAAATCTACGGFDTDGSGYCSQCGQSMPTGRDHLEIELDEGAAGITDRGLRRRRNEDAMALVSSDKLVIGVVCDGVATSPRGDEAAISASELGAAKLLEELAAGATHHEATVRACRVSAAAVAAMGVPDDAPACTYVSAIVEPGTITIGWIGDSRAYWLPESAPAVLLSQDDVASHGVLTSWLGADADVVDAHVHTFAPESPGLLLACSDGLWEYLTREAFPQSGTPLERARDLLRHALASGGRDNVTIVLIPGGPA
ncbi:MAG: serine/threonine-protein phosphatase [Thermoactinospora sp.]|nr:serine/threonine-protein phosphatase [Thermoactinospora sp.]